ncbi:MAG: type II secretion system F family protein [Planctomycetia bacterium]|nr:type II secretion system F family protein [Planctomycetia bacterium]
MLFLSAAISFSDLVPFAVFGLFAAGAWLLLEMLASRNPRAQERLEELRYPTARRRNQESAAPVKKSATMTKVLSKATPMARPLQPKSVEDVGKLKGRLSQGGFRSEGSVGIFLGLKFIGLLIGLASSGGTALLTSSFSQSALIYAVLVSAGFFYLPDAVVWLIARRRKEAIFLSLPDVLDLLVVCVEAGLGLDQAMRKVSEEMKKSCRVVAEEFALCNFQLQMGRARTEVLQDLGARTGVDDLRSLAAILIQADRFGSSIAQALRVQSDSMRTRRRQLAEEKAAKTSVKLIFPLVIFIFPAVFVVLVGPAAITIVNEMFPMMAGGK